MNLFGTLTGASLGEQRTTPAVRQVQVVQRALGLDSLPETFPGIKTCLDAVDGSKMYSTSRTASAFK